MKATVENINSVQRRVKVTVPAEEVSEAFDAIYRKIQKNARIQGFRPGKAPLGIIRRSYAHSVAGEVGENLVNQKLFDALDENKVKPISPPVVESMDTPTADKDYEFSAIIDVMPVVEIKDYKGLAVAVKDYKVADAMVEHELKSLRRRMAKTSPLEGAPSAAIGHLATISHTAEVDGEQMKHMDVKDIPVALGENEIFPDLEAGVVGMAKGDHKKITVAVPAEYQDKQLAGKSVVFDVTLNDLSALQLPELDDDFAKDLDVDSLEELRTRIVENLEYNAQQARSRELENAIMDALRNRYDFEVPPAMVEQVTDGIIQDMGIKDEAMLKKALADENLRKSYREEAKKRARNTLLLWEVAKAENIEVSDDDVKESIKEHLEGSQGGANTDAASIDRLFQSSGNQIRENMLLGKAMDFLTNAATITNIPANI